MTELDLSLAIFDLLNSTSSSSSSLDKKTFDSADDNNQERSTTIPPKLETSDYIEIFLLIFMVIIGGPLNLVSLFRSLNISINIQDLYRFCFFGGGAFPFPFQERRRRRRPLNLRFHLTIANLLVLWVYGLSEIVWFCTYSWHGGDLLCKGILFCHALCFYATSNLVAAIGLDRLYVTVYINRPRYRSTLAGRLKKDDTVRLLSSIAWLLAFLSSIPQLFVWGTFEPFDGWAQCVSIFNKKKYEHLLLSAANGNKTNETADDDRFDQLHLEKLYDGLHLALVFWIPAIFITVSYISIVTRFNWNIRKNSRAQFESESIIQTNSSSIKRRLTFAAFGVSSTSRRPPSSTVDSNQHPKLNSSAGNLLQLPCSPIIKTNDNSNHDGVELETVSTNLTLNENKIIDDEISSNCNSTKYYVKNIPTDNFAVITLTRAKKSAVRKTIWILLAYFIFWSPYNILALWRYFNPTFEHSYLEILYNLIVLNAVVNPLIYGI